MSVTRAEFEALYARAPDALYALFQRQAAQVAALAARVEQLEARPGGHSQNSHRPPASDGPRTPPRGRRPRSGRAPDGQAGHPGHTLEMAATPDQVVDHRPSRCAACGTALAAATASAVARRQVVDLPPLRLVATEHRAATVRCPRCRRATAAPFPAHVTRPVQYGPRLLGLGVYLRRYRLLPYLRSRDLLGDLFGASPAVGTLHAASLAGAAALAGVEAAIGAALRAAPVLHADETGAGPPGQPRRRGQTRRHAEKHQRAQGGQHEPARGARPPGSRGPPRPISTPAGSRRGGRRASAPPGVAAPGLPAPVLPHRPAHRVGGGGGRADNGGMRPVVCEYYVRRGLDEATLRAMLYTPCPDAACSRGHRPSGRTADSAAQRPFRRRGGFGWAFPPLQVTPQWRSSRADRLVAAAGPAWIRLPPREQVSGEILPLVAATASERASAALWCPPDGSRMSPPGTRGIEEHRMRWGEAP